MMMTTMTVAMLGAVVAAVAGAALAPAILPPAHAAAGDPGTLAFEFGSLGRDAGEFRSVRDVAIGPSGRIAVADTGDNIEVFHPNGTFAFSVGSARVHQYDYVDIGPDGSIVAGSTHGASHVFHPNGSFNYWFSPHGSVKDMAIGPDGRIVVGASDARIHVFHPNGTLAFSFGELGTDVGEFRSVISVAVAPNGLIAAVNSDSNVWVFHPNGTLAGEFMHRHSDVYDVTFSPSGEVALGWSGGRKAHIHVFHPNGTSAFNVTGIDNYDIGGPAGLVVGRSTSSWVTISAFNGLGPADEWQPSWVFQPPPPSLLGAGVLYVPPAPAPSLTAIAPAFEFGSYGEGPGEFLAPHNIAVGPGGVIAVSDAENNRVQLFHPNGTFALEVGSRGSGLGEFAGPHGLAFGPNGILIVSDVGNHRVQVFRIQ